MKPYLNVSVDSQRAIFSAALISAFGIAFFNALPLVLGTAAEELGFSNEQLGFVASSYMAGFTLMSVALIVWARKINWRKACTAMAILQFCSYLLSTQTLNLEMLLAILFLAGIGGGGLFGIAMISLADTKQPDRNLGIATFAQVVLPAALVLYLSMSVIPNWGFSGLMIVLAVLPGIGLLLLPFVASSGKQDQPVTDDEEVVVETVKLIVALIGALIFHSASSAVWAFYERIGDANGISAEAIGGVLSGALIAGGAGSLVPIFMHAQIGRLVTIVVASLIQIACFISLIISPETTYSYAAFVFMFAWTAAIIFQMGGIAEADSSGKYSVAIPAVLGLATIIGPAIGGYLLGEDRFDRLLIVAGVTVLVALIPAVYVNKKTSLSRSVLSEG